MEIASLRSQRQGNLARRNILTQSSDAPSGDQGNSTCRAALGSRFREDDNGVNTHRRLAITRSAKRRMDRITSAWGRAPKFTSKLKYVRPKRSDSIWILSMHSL